MGPAVIVTLLGGTVVSAASANEGRVVGSIDVSHVHVTRGNLLPLTREGNDLGRVEGTVRLSGVSLDLAPTAEQAADLATLLAAQHDRSSPQYHRWLTPHDYAGRFGASASDLAKIVRWLEGEGFTVSRVSTGANEIIVSGTVAQVEATFRTEVHRYRIGSETHVAMAVEPALPHALVGVVTGVRGIDDFALRPQYTQGGQHYVGPADLATIYGTTALYAKGLDGTGTSLAVVGQGYYTPSDIATYRAKTGLPAMDLHDLMVPNTGNPAFVDAGYLLEAEMDLELIGAVAPNAKVTYVYTGGAMGFNVLNALKYAIDTKVASIVSVSAGGCEALYSPALVSWLKTMGDQANAQGMTIVGVTGDTGAAGCDYGKPSVATKGLAVLLPGSLPQLTAVGGTTFVEGGGSYWNGSNGPGLSSALSYIPETTWNDVAKTGVLLATGGGVSTLFAKPAWQAGSGVPADAQRDVPDVSMPAGGSHDGYVTYLSPPAVPGAAGLYFGYGGTSAGAPSFAGVLALVLQATGGTGLGNANPMLYQIAAQLPGAFHDITTGDNVVPCTAGTKDCPASAPHQYGYSAGPGYDLATGLGSVDTAALVDAWLACEAYGPTCAPAGGTGGGAGAGGIAGSGGAGGDPGTGGAGGDAGTGGAGGDAGTGGTGGAAGNAGVGGTGNASGGNGNGGVSSAGSSGNPGTGGAGGKARSGAFGGSAGKAGNGGSGAGGASPSGGGAGNAGMGGNAGSSLAGGVGGKAAGGMTAAGVGGSGGSTLVAKGGNAGSATTASGGKAAVGGAGMGGVPEAMAPSSSDSSGGCGCTMPGGRGGAPPGAWLVGALALLFARRRSAKRNACPVAGTS
jgi:MYXO-CTERM domain-containing protein